MTATVVGPVIEQASSAACALVLRELPDWFGIEESLQEYVDHAAEYPTFVSRDGEDITGVLSVKHHSPQAAELYVVGIRPKWHGTGHGLALLTAAETWLRSEAVRFFQVKTIGPSSDDVPYARTREWYKRQGFVHLEEFPLLWAEGNPALIMIKTLD